VDTYLLYLMRPVRKLKLKWSELGVVSHLYRFGKKRAETSIVATHLIVSNYSPLRTHCYFDPRRPDWFFSFGVFIIRWSVFCGSNF